MAKAAEVPVTPSVLRWAIAESGYSEQEVANKVKVTIKTLRLWLDGQARPNRTQFGRLKTAVRRQAAVFLLPEPPTEAQAEVRFRHPHDSDRKVLNPVERRLLRRAGRLQRTVAWLAREMGQRPLKVPEGSSADQAADHASAIRSLLGVGVDEQLAWGSPVDAQRGWRAALEGTGLMVLFLPLGTESLRGFSLWDDYAPLVAVNTAWKYEARVFTMFHEVGHLVLRNNSACLGYPGPRLPAASDRIERWCEQFAASVLLPKAAVREFAVDHLGVRDGRQVTELRLARRLANAFRVSVRASVLRLIDCDLAGWSLWKQIPPLEDRKRRGGPPGEGRRRPQKRIDEYGVRTARTFLDGIDGDLITRSDVQSQLNVRSTALDEIAALS